MSPTNLVPIKPSPPPSRERARQTKHLSQALQLEETGTSRLVHLAMALAGTAMVVFLGWSAMTRIDEVATAEGQVVPSGESVTVQHLEGGLIDQVMVTEGQKVEAGQPMVRMSAAASSSDLDQSRAREASLLIKAERLRAFVEGRQPNFSFALPNYERLVADHLAIFKAQIQAEGTARAVLQSQVDQKRSDLQLLHQQEKTMQDQINALDEEAKMRSDMVAQHLVTKMQYLDSLRELARMRGEMAHTQSQAITAGQAVSEYESRLTDLRSAAQKQSMEDLSTTVADLAQVQESIGRLSDRVARLEVDAPAKGYIKGLTVHNPGAVVQPGGVVCQIIPVDRELKVEAKVTTRDVGFVSPGQRVRIKVNTFDFARYGAIMGTLQYVSADSFLSEKGEPYFKAMVVLDKGYVGDAPGHLVIGPGMTVSAEIITGDKTLLQYMLKPIYASMQQSFHER